MSVCMCIGKTLFSGSSHKHACHVRDEIIGGSTPQEQME